MISYTFAFKELFITDVAKIFPSKPGNHMLEKLVGSSYAIQFCIRPIEERGNKLLAWPNMLIVIVSRNTLIAIVLLHINIILHKYVF